MPVMEKLKMFVVQEPVVAASCLIAGVGLFLPAVADSEPQGSSLLSETLRRLVQWKSFAGFRVTNCSWLWVSEEVTLDTKFQLDGSMLIEVVAGVTGKKQG
ncbi:UNVERIFIED_CONTAM: hypothetical protein Scaly_1787600 [Sesamum calycinum]|uniref:Uncharacterized protein n=1 Tax=Sesamum calycinum TaxID=2727403 RepID=A0AAW2NWX2_9LAMI